jgi:hypothetical protein
MTTEESQRELVEQLSVEQLVFLLDKSTPEFRLVIEAELRKRKAAR